MSHKEIGVDNQFIDAATKINEAIILAEGHSSEFLRGMRHAAKLLRQPTTQSLTNQLTRLQAENERLKEALVFYGERANYRLISGNYIENVIVDFGNRARRALNNES